MCTIGGVVRHALALDVLGQLFSGAGASTPMHDSSSDATARRRDEDDRAIVEADGTTRAAGRRIDAYRSSEWASESNVECFITICA